MTEEELLCLRHLSKQKRKLEQKLGDATISFGAWLAKEVKRNKKQMKRHRKRVRYEQKIEQINQKLEGLKNE